MMNKLADGRRETIEVRLNRQARQDGGEYFYPQITQIIADGKQSGFNRCESVKSVDNTFPATVNLKNTKKIGKIGKIERIGKIEPCFAASG
jgi:hypothetical protein